MTSTKLRKAPVIHPSVFPCMKMSRALRRVKDVRKVCWASIDRVSLKVSERHEHFGRYEYFESKAMGWIYHFQRAFMFGGKRQVIRFQIFIRKDSSNRTLMLNPRHFLNFDRPVPAFEKFVHRLGLKDFRVTRIDLSFQLARHLVSCDFIRWAMYVEGVRSSTVVAVEYEDEMHRRIAKAKYESYRVGKKPLSVQIYDADARNSKGKKSGDESTAMKGVYNLEFRLHRDHKVVKSVKSVRDIFSIDPRGILQGVHFVDIAKSISPRELLPAEFVADWDIHGLQLARRSEYARGKTHGRISKFMVPLMFGKLPFKDVLIKTASGDLAEFSKRKVLPERDFSKPIAYSMPVLFGQ